MTKGEAFPIVEATVVYDRQLINSLLPEITPRQTEIIDFVDRLEPGSKLALEVPPEFLEPDETGPSPVLPAGFEYSTAFQDLGPQVLTGTSSIGFHLQAAAMHAKQRGLEVSCLADADKIVDISFSQARASLMNDYLRREWAVIDGVLAGDKQLPVFEAQHAKELEEIAREIYRLQLAAQFTHDVVAPDEIVAKIKAEKPDAAIVNEKMAYLLVPDYPEFLAFNGVREATVDDHHIAILGVHEVRKRSPSNVWIPWETKVADYMKARERLERAMRAQNEGRVMTEGQPRFVGTFTPERDAAAAEGLFEVYVAHDGVFAGVIEDICGTAQFTGTLTEEAVWFRKEYIPGKFLDTNQPVALNYEGLRQPDGSYEGIWRSEDESFDGKFRLRQPEK